MTGTRTFYLPSETGLLDGNRNTYIRLYVVEEWNDATNKSTLTVRLQTKKNNLSLSGLQQAGTLSISRNGGAYEPILTYSRINSLDSWSNAIVDGYDWVGVYTVDHNSDGTGTVAFRLNRSGANPYFQFSGSYGGRVYIVTAADGTTWTKTLYTIPRASTLTAADGTLGVQQSLTVQRASSSFLHTVEYTCGTEHGVIADRTAGTALTFLPPMDLAAQNTSGSTVPITYTLKTISEGIVIGTTSITRTLAIPDSIAPEISPGWAAVSYYNTGTKAEDIADYVQGYSKAEVSFDSSLIDMSGTYGAQIASYKIIFGASEAGEAPYRTPVLNNPGDTDVLCIVYDTRGHSAYERLSFRVQAYSQPTLSGIEIFRCTAGGVRSESGTWLSVKALAGISDIGGLNTVTLRTQYKQASGSYGAKTTIPNGSAAVIGGGLISTTATYIVRIEAEDALSNLVSYEASIPTAAVAFNLREGGLGAGFGKYCERDKAVEIPADWEIYKGNESYASAIASAVMASVLLAAHPVGEIYTSSDPTSPAELFGGTWESLSGVYIYAADEAHPAGSTFGEATHTLTVNEMPSHNHTSAGLPENQSPTWASGYTRTAYAVTSVNPYPDNVPTNYSGGGQPHNNLPPSYAAYAWRRTA